MAARPSLLSFASAATENLRTGSLAPLSSLWEGSRPTSITFLRRLG